MPRPSLSYANVMSTIAVFLALGGGAWAMSGPPSTPTTVDACVKKKGKKKGQLRIVSASTTCRTSERKLTWSAAGPTGPKGDKGDAGPKGDQGEPGTSGAADTPVQILNKLSTVDGSGSGLDASLLDGYDSSHFLSTSGKAADANLLDGINSSGFAKLSASSSAAIGLPAIGAHSCVDYNNVTLGGVDPGDVVIVREGDATNLPAGLVMMSGAAQDANNVHLRFCNVLGAASVADGNVPIRWYAFNP